jgi:hypothetical protein
MRASSQDAPGPIDLHAITSSWEEGNNTGGRSNQRVGEERRGCTLNPLCPAVTTTVDDALILRIGGFDDDQAASGDSGTANFTLIASEQARTVTIAPAP